MAHLLGGPSEIDQIVGHVAEALIVRDVEPVKPSPDSSVSIVVTPRAAKCWMSE